MARCRPNRSSFATKSTVAFRRKRRRPHASVSVVGSREAAGKDVSVCGPDIGPSVWGPEDWGEEAPTMAMLAEPAARQLKPSARGGGERPGPIWRLIFGGMTQFERKGRGAGFVLRTSENPSRIGGKIYRSVNRNVLWVDVAPRGGITPTVTIADDRC